MRFQTACSLAALAVASALVAGCATTAGTDAPAAPRIPGAEIPTQLPRNVRPLHYRISAVPDAPNLRFSATALIDIAVLEPSDSITLNAADLDFRSVSLTGADGAQTKAARIATDAGKQTATFHFSDRIAPGSYRLAIDYGGKIYTQAAGFFALDYDSAAGRQRALFTQFQAPDARRFFPGWDEPQFRTPYDLSVAIPAGQTAVSNMPQAAAETRPDGSRLIRFQTTPAMSSYLLFLGIGAFDRIVTTAGGTEIGVVTKRGDGEKGRYALEGSARLVPWFNRYFGMRYPLPKLDNVAGPGSSQVFGAMENWGAIFSFESILLVDPSITTEATRQRIFAVAAHEIAHQWFGNLVTMAWWDDLWLNEGFASWIATKATDALHPEWEPLLGRINGRELAINLDSVRTTHPIVQRLATVDQISQAFDNITYEKGEAVITMLEDYVGEEAWQRGVQEYLRAHRLGSTASDDLWQKIEAAAGKPVTAVAHDFTLQQGVPLIRVENAACAGGRTTVALRQGEFSRDRMDKQPLSWRVPVIASTLGGGAARTLVAGGAASAIVSGCGPLIVNSGQTGYYRTLYAPALLDRLTASYARLKPVDQIGLLADSWGLGLAGYQSASKALDLIEAAPGDANPVLAGRISTILGQVHGLYEGDPAHQAMVARYASAKLGPVLKRLGWAGNARETSNGAILRANLIGTLGAVGDAEILAEARRRFNAADPAALEGPLRSAILGMVARNADAAAWDRLHAMARAEKSRLAREQLYALLGAARDETLARRALALALTDEPGTTTSSAIISAVAAAHPELAFDFALRNKEAVEGLVDISSRSSYLPGLADGSGQRETIAKLQDYAGRYMTPESRKPADIAIAAIEDRIRVRETRLPDISRWFEARSR